MNTSIASASAEQSCPRFILRHLKKRQVNRDSIQLMFVLLVGFAQYH
jgi:hypothetical protein